ncbi:uncharacterized protein LOC112188973 isoform X2 [Rosa chinensis]|uniref:uncharacterized protein LOC112188973 isoform X2 n=1 Tax=Rosa chinensis TaxID=74649 RepID=UPI001AD93F39|nr:uncharacterized protein LOC112188973 isoform X2 [Rosa chinensis]
MYLDDGASNSYLVGGQYRQKESSANFNYSTRLCDHDLTVCVKPQEEVDEDRISKMPDDVLCFQVKIGCYSVHILKHLCGEETSLIPNDEEPSCDGVSRLANHTFSHTGKHYPWSCIDRYGWKIQGQ